MNNFGSIMVENESFLLVGMIVHKTHIQKERRLKISILIKRVQRVRVTHTHKIMYSNFQ